MRWASAAIGVLGGACAVGACAPPPAAAPTDAPPNVPVAAPVATASATAVTVATASVGVAEAPKGAPAADPRRVWALAYVGKLSGDALQLRRFWSAKRPELEALVAQYDRECGAGEAIACTAAAALAEQLGQGMETRAAAYVKACKAGELVACARLSLLWPCHHVNHEVRLTHRMKCDGLDAADALLGEEGLPSHAKHHRLVGARVLGKRACDGGVAAGCAAVGASYEERPNDLQQAVEVYARGCELGSFGACRRAFQVGREARKASLAPDLGARADAAAKKQLALAMDACDAGDPTACALAAAQVAEGGGVPRSVAEARALYQRACDGKVDHACDDLARLPKER